MHATRRNAAYATPILDISSDGAVGVTTRLTACAQCRSTSQTSDASFWKRRLASLLANVKISRYFITKMSNEDLIELVRQYPVIYNVKLREYRDTAMKNEAWEEISRIKHMSIEECKSMWTKLRNCYNNAIKRRVKKSGQAAKRIAPWRYEEQMSFLLPFLEGKDSWGNPEKIVEDNDSPQSERYFNLQSPTTGTSPPSPSLLSNLCTPTPSNLRCYNKRQNTPDRQMAEMLAMKENPQNNRNERDQMDDTDYFFLSMSHMLKKLPKLDQTKIKMDIHRAIHEAELRQLERHEAQRPMPITIKSSRHTN